MNARPAHSRTSTMEGCGRAPSSSSRTCSTPLRPVSLQRDTPGSRPVSADKVDDDMDCSTWTAEERVAHKKEGHETTKTDTRHDKEMMETISTRYPRHNIWAPRQWPQSTSKKRRLYVPEEKRNSKRYGHKNKQMELITYNAMYAGNWLRMQDISQTFPHGVVGIQGAKQRRDPEAPAYNTKNREARCVRLPTPQYG